MKIVAKQDTLLKKTWKDSSDPSVTDSDIHEVEQGKSYDVVEYYEGSLQGDWGAHVKVTLDYEQGEWFVYVPHWSVPWQDQVIQQVTTLPSWKQIDWYDMDCMVSKYFTVREVALGQKDRIPVANDIRQNIVGFAQKNMDMFREWYEQPLYVNSWYRPPHVEKAIGGSGANHPYGYAVDFRPADGDIWTLQRRFKIEIYDTGKFNGGFGQGARKGFIHVDGRHRRTWPY